MQAPTPPGTDEGAPDAPGGYYKRSDSAIQRAYDAAPGPPSKQDYQAQGPPSAPPAPPTSLPPNLPSPPAKGAKPPSRNMVFVAVYLLLSGRAPLLNFPVP